MKPAFADAQFDEDIARINLRAGDPSRWPDAEDMRLRAYAYKALADREYQRAYFAAIRNGVIREGEGE